jgi:pentatricopeptide repeat protein
LGYNYLGEVLVRKEEIEEAIALFNQAINLYPEEALSYKNIGDALAKQGKVHEASDFYKRAIELGFK